MTEQAIAKAPAPTPVEPIGTLFDYALYNAQDPGLFRNQPSVAARLALRVGQAVKIGLQRDGVTPEHFWVEIVERRGEQGFVGRIDNNIFSPFGVRRDDHIVFCIQHIREIEADPE